MLPGSKLQPNPIHPAGWSTVMPDWYPIDTG